MHENRIRSCIVFYVTSLDRVGARTLEEVGELVEVAGGEVVKVLPGPDRADEDGGEEAGCDADGDGGEALVREADELLDAVARHGHQAEGEDEDGHAVVVPRLHLRDEPRERRRRCCNAPWNQTETNAPAVSKSLPCETLTRQGSVHGHGTCCT
jgi:hypothetical protein